jgi:hypothetical protein
MLVTRGARQGGTVGVSYVIRSVSARLLGHNTGLTARNKIWSEPDSTPEWLL